MGKFNRKSIPGVSPGQRDWSADWGEEGWGWGKSWDFPAEQ